MVKTYLKTFARMFKKHITRLVSIFLMVLVSVGFSAGIGMGKDALFYSLSDYYKSQNVSDFIVRGSEAITDEQLSALQERYGSENVVRGGILEIKGGEIEIEMATPFGGSINATLTLAGEGIGEGVTRIYIKDAKDRDKQNASTEKEATMSEGDPSQNEFYIAAERPSRDIAGVPLGETVTVTAMMGSMQLFEYKFTVTEHVVGALHFAQYDDPSMQKKEGGGEDDYELLENILYVYTDADHALLFPMNEAYISVPALKEHTLFDTSYKSALETEQAAIEEIFKDGITAESCAVLTLHENFAYRSFEEYEDKLEGIGYVIMVVFLLVTLLVVLSTMTRLLDEERGQIACLQTLGYSPMRIVSKYLLFALVGTIIGGGGAFAASWGLAYIIYINFTWVYEMPPFSHHIAPLFFFIVTAIILLATLAATLIAGLRMTHRTPAALLRPKSPRPGHKVILEKIPALWNRVSFKYKSTLRNVLRYKMRFIMTIVAVMASTGLVLAGLAVLDACLFTDVGTNAMIGVAVIVLVFAALLNAVVIYTLTNINISERERELATLMVLGYQDNEVTGYIYREVYITSSIGIALGLPFGALLCFFVFKVMNDFATLSSINWFVWLLAPIVSLLFTALVTLILRRKITGIKMNDSLKAVE